MRKLNFCFFLVWSFGLAYSQEPNSFLNHFSDKINFQKNFLLSQDLINGKDKKSIQQYLDYLNNPKTTQIYLFSSDKSELRYKVYGHQELSHFEIKDMTFFDSNFGLCEHVYLHLINKPKVLIDDCSIDGWKNTDIEVYAQIEYYNLLIRYARKKQLRIAIKEETFSVDGDALDIVHSWEDDNVVVIGEAPASWEELIKE